MVSTSRDYGLVGADSKRAVESGLANAEWYRPPIDPTTIQQLALRHDARAFRDTVLWIVLLVGFGVTAWRLSNSWWSVPVFLAYGALYGGSSDSRWHEMGHGTAFKTGWLNEVVYYAASFMLLREPTLWRWSHVRHHTDTIIVGRDAEIIFPRPTTRMDMLLTLIGWKVVPPMVKRMAKHALGTVDEDAKQFIPEPEWNRVVWEARLFLAGVGAVILWSVAAGSIVPALLFGLLPTMYGAWLLVFFGLTQHAGLQEDVLDHRLNTRTVYMNPVFRFLYSNMNYHVEHHLFPTVPYHSLPRLHDEIKRHLAPPMPGVVSAYKEILATLPKQAIDTTYEIPNRGVPESTAQDRFSRPDAGASLWSTLASDGSVDLGPVDSLVVGQVKRVQVEGLGLAVYRIDQETFATTDDLCTHGQASLSEGLFLVQSQSGAQSACTIECPKHNGRFDVRTGKPLRKPVTETLRTYPTSAVSGRIVAQL